MCGIVGMARFDRQAPEPAVLVSMASRIAHRGPDDEGSYCSGPVAFHHLRLSIIDLASGHQPMTAGDVTIAFNGEIYNYLELRDELKGRGHTFSTASDTEVILRLYQEYGEDGFVRLNGMFAFLLHDRRRNRLVAARDHLGVKPLYWWANERCRLYASEIKALLAHPDVGARVNQPALEEYLTFQYTLGNETL